MSTTDLNSKFNIILASNSPRRKEILAGMDLQFDVMTKEVEEVYPADLPLAEIPEYLARLKANAFLNDASLADSDLVITADTIVAMDGKVYGKPRDQKDARTMLQELSDNSHEVITGVCLTSLNKQVSFSVSTKVFVNALTQEEIEYYVRSYNPMDKAGAYAIQEWFGAIGISRIEGEYLNIVGLPANALYQEMKKF